MVFVVRVLMWKNQAFQEKLESFKLIIFPYSELHRSLCFTWNYFRFTLSCWCIGCTILIFFVYKSQVFLFFILFTFKLSAYGRVIKFPSECVTHSCNATYYIDIPTGSLWLLIKLCVAHLLLLRKRLNLRQSTTTDDSGSPSALNFYLLLYLFVCLSWGWGWREDEGIFFVQQQNLLGMLLFHVDWWWPHNINEELWIAIKFSYYNNF